MSVVEVVVGAAMVRVVAEKYQHLVVDHLLRRVFFLLGLATFKMLCNV